MEYFFVIKTIFLTFFGLKIDFYIKINQVLLEKLKLRLELKKQFFEVGKIFTHFQLCSRITQMFDDAAIVFALKTKWTSMDY